MDLPTCPACQQSVLDDDVDECPFCGASLSGKTVAGKPTSGKPVAAKPASKPSVEKPKQLTKDQNPSTKPLEKSEPDPELSAEDDPFELENKVEGKTVRLRRKPEPGRSHKVVCPMCETPGYTARKAAGMRVQCASSECLMPVFTAPLLQKEPTHDPSEETARGSKTLWMVVAGVLVLGGAVGAWFVFFSGGEEPRKPTLLEKPENSQMQPANLQNKIKKKPGTSEKKIATKKKVDPAVLRNDILKRMKQVVETRSRNNINKPFCRENAAVAFAAMGQLDNAKDQIQKLEVGASNYPFYRVVPWLEVGWWHLKNNTSTSKKDALSAWKNAEASYRRVPSTGPTRFELTTARAAFLYALGDKERAEKLIEDYVSFSDVELIAIQKMALEKLKHFDLELQRTFTFYSTDGDLAGAAVALHLVSHNRGDLAFKWALERAAKIGHGDALLAWADGEMVRSRGDDIIPSKLATKIQGLSSQIKTLVFAHVATFESEESQEFLRLAEVEFAIFLHPQPINLKTVRDVSSASLSQKKWIPYATAAFQLAVAKNIVHGQEGSDETLSAIEKGVSYLRSVTPGVMILRELQKQAESNPAKLRQDIVKEYRLTNNSQIDIQVREYLQALKSINKNAARRFQQQVALLSWVSLIAETSLIDKIWKTLQKHRTEKETNRQEPYFETPLPWLLIALLNSKGAGETAKTFESELSQAKISKPGNVELVTASVKEPTKVNTTALAELISSMGTQSQKFHSSLIVASRLVKAGKPKLAIDFAKRIGDDNLRLAVLQSIGGLSIASELGAEVSKFTSRGMLPPAEMSALCRGIFWGLQSAE